MSSPCQLPCPPPCAAQPGPCPELDTALGTTPCPQITAQPAELCTPGTCVESSPSPSLEPCTISSPSLEPCTIETPGMCVLTFPLQKNILGVELCPSDGIIPLAPDEPCPAQPLGTRLESISLGDPCTLEVLEPCPEGVGMGDPCSRGDPCASQSASLAEPGLSQSVTEPSAQGMCSAGLGDSGDTAKDPKSCSSFRLSSRTSGIVERCLARCQGWFRGKN